MIVIAISPSQNLSHALLSDSFQKVKENIELSARIIAAARSNSAILTPLTGERKISKVFPAIPSELTDKSDQIYFILSNANRY